MTLYPSRLSRWRTDSRSLDYLFFSFLHFRAPRRLADSLAPRSAPLLRAPLLVCLSPCAPLPVSPLPCLRSDTVWLVLWLAGDGAPRSLSVVRSSGVCWTRPFSFSDSPLLGSVPSRCRCFTLLTPLACFLWYFVVSCGAGWASTSVDNVLPPFHFR